MNLKLLLVYGVAAILGLGVGNLAAPRPPDRTFRDAKSAVNAFYESGVEPRVAFEEKVAAMRKKMGVATGEARIVSYEERDERTVIVEVMVPRKSGEVRERLTLDLLRGVTAYEPVQPR